MKYPFNELQIGDAFDVPVSSTTRAAIAQLCWKYGVKLGRKFSCRHIPNEGVYEVSRAERETVHVSEIKRARQVVRRTEAQTVEDARLAFEAEHRQR